MNGTGNGGDSKVEPITYLLVGCIFALLVILLALAKWDANDGQTFQVVAGLITTFSGALFTRLKPRGTTDDSTIPLPPNPSKVSVHATTDTVSETAKPKE